MLGDRSQKPEHGKGAEKTRNLIGESTIAVEHAKLISLCLVHETQTVVKKNVAISAFYRRLPERGVLRPTKTGPAARGTRSQWRREGYAMPCRKSNVRGWRGGVDA